MGLSGNRDEAIRAGIMATMCICELDIFVIK
jgi:hypothetical protein